MQPVADAGWMFGVGQQAVIGLRPHTKFPFTLHGL
jgi:hypothetical protein